MNVTAQDCKKNLKLFTWVIWKHLGLPRPTDVQVDILDYLENGGDRIIIEAFRGVGKSYLTSVYVLWRLFNDPSEKFLIVSASKIRSDEFSIFTKRLINEVEMLSPLRGGFRDSNVAFDVGGSGASHAPSVKAVGITGQLTGSRATEVIADDIEVISNSLTNDMRAKLLHRCGEFESVLVPGGKIKYLGTPQNYETIYNKLAERGYKLRVWTARMPAAEDFLNYKGCLAPMITESNKDVGEPVDPQRFDESDLKDRESNMGRSTFKLQFMLDTTMSDEDRFPLRTRDLIVMPIEGDKAPTSIQWGAGKDQCIQSIPTVGMGDDAWYKPLFYSEDWVEFEGSVLAIDPSGRGKDNTGYAVVKALHGKLYVTSLGGIKGGYSDGALQKLANIAKEEKVNAVYLESNFGNGMFTKLFMPFLVKTHPCTIQETTAKGQKELRIINTLEPVVSGHRLIINQSVVEEDSKLARDPLEYFHSFGYQFTRINRSRGSLKHDDALDALAMAVEYWQDTLATDEKVAEENTRLNFAIEEMEKTTEWLKGGSSSKSLNWVGI
jgi:hypothetical protein